MKYFNKTIGFLLIAGLLIPKFISSERLLEEFRNIRALKMKDIPGFLDSLRLPSGSIELFKGIEIESPKVEKGPEGFEDSIMISGKGKINNKFPITAKLVIVIKDKIRRFSLGFGLPEEMKISDIVSRFKTLDKLSIPSAAIEVSEFDYTMKSGEAFERGININGKWELTGPLQLVKKFLEKMKEFLNQIKPSGKLLDSFIFEGDSLSFSGVIREDIEKSRFTAALPLQIGIDFTKFTKAKVFTYIKTLAWQIDLQPIPDLEFDIGGSIEVGIAGQKEPLQFSGDVEIADTKTGIEAAMKGMWDPAFGAKWLAIGDFGLEINWDYTIQSAFVALGIPFTGLGGRGTIYLGKRRDTGEITKLNLEMLTSFEAKEIEFLLQGKAENLRLSDFIMFLLNRAKKDISFDLPLVNFKKLNIYVAPRAIEFAEKEYDAGLTVDAEAEIGKLSGRFNVKVDPENLQISGTGALSNIDKKFFKLTGTGPDQKLGTLDDGPSINLGLYIDRPAQSYFMLNGRVEIPPLGLIAEVKNASIKKSGIEGSFETEIVKAFKIKMDLTIPFEKSEYFEASFDFRQDFDDYLNKTTTDDIRNEFEKLEIKAAEALRKLDKKIEETKKQYDDLVNAEINRVNKRIDELKGEIKTLTDDIKDSRALCLKLGKVEGGIKERGKECKEYATKEVIRDKKALELSGLVTYRTTILKGGAQLPSTILTVSDKLVEYGRRKKLQEKALNVLIKIFEVFKKIRTVVIVKKVSGEVNGKDLLEGKLPKLKELLIEFNLNTTILRKKITIKETLDLKDIQFDFK